MPAKYKAENLLAAMKPLLKGYEKVLIPRAKVARSVLPEGLRDLGCRVDVVEAYRTEADTAHKEELLDVLEHHGADIITFTSSSTVYNLMNQIDGRTDLLKGVTLACIGPITAATCRKYNLEPSIISDIYTIDGLVNAIEKGVEKK